MNSLAPIALFTYIRIDKLKKTLKYLKRNKLSKSSTLYVFSDNYKLKKDIKKIKKLRAFLNTINGFKKIYIIKRKKNFGLEKNITSGISKVINKHNKIIVMEDDIIVSENFLDFMNLCLNKFRDKKKVWHINAWNYGFNFQKSKYNTFYWRAMICWGWGTWKDRWKYYKKNPDYLIKNWSTEKIKKFNIENSTDYWSQVVRNHKKLINTWAIFWYSTIFDKKGICLSPVASLTQNIGNDKYSTHQPNKNLLSTKINRNFFNKKKIKI